MKKILFAATTALFLIILSSCERERIIVEKEIVYTEPPVSMCSFPFDVYQEQWAYPELIDNNFFYAQIECPEITSDILASGMVKVYRTWSRGTANEVQMELPYSRLIEEWIDDGEDSGYVYYTEQVDYEIVAGMITVYFTTSDFFYEVDETILPEDMSFRCVVLQNNEQ